MLTRMIMIMIILIFQDNHDHYDNNYNNVEEDNWLVSREVEIK